MRRDGLIVQPKDGATLAQVPNIELEKYDRLHRQ